MIKFNIIQHFWLIFFISIFHVSALFAQKDVFIYKGIIIDSITQTPLQNVSISRIFNNDTIKIKSTDGRFEVIAGTGAKLNFRKSGYAWHIIKILDRNMQNIYMVPSKSHQMDIGKNNYNRTEIIFDGEVISQEEWDDVCSIHHDEIASLEIYVKDGINKIIFTSKP